MGDTAAEPRMGGRMGRRWVLWNWAPTKGCPYDGADGYLEFVMGLVNKV
jgi:hypothetical protein